MKRVIIMVATGMVLIVAGAAAKLTTMENTGNSKELLLTSTAFVNNGYIPATYTCEGEDYNPGITIRNIPAGTESIAIIIEDPDAPKGVFDHWIAWNIAPVGSIAEHSAPGVQGLNGSGKPGYMGPCPPDDKPHRYFFKVYALDVLLGLKANSEKKDLQREMQGHILAEGVLVGLYKKTR